jgi:hypothetical protein
MKIFQVRKRGREETEQRAPAAGLGEPRGVRGLAGLEDQDGEFSRGEPRRAFFTGAPAPWTWLQPPAISIGAEVRAVGESYYQDALEAVSGGRTPFGTRTRLLTVLLVREPDNPFDENAVRVEAGGATLAHLSRDDAPRFHAILDRLAGTGLPASCRAMLTGGWDYGPSDRGRIGISVFTGRRPAKRTGRGAFLPAVPWHEHHAVTLDPGGPGIAGMADRLAVTLADMGSGCVAVMTASGTVGQIKGRPDLAAFVSRVGAAGLPATAQARLADGKLTVAVSDPDAVQAALDTLGSADLTAIRRSIPPTGRWVCQRCHRIWTDPRQPPRRWYDIMDDNSGSPHICPQCWSYKFTHPI